MLSDYSKIVIETEEDEPKVIATITDQSIDAAEGFQVRLTPNT